MRTKHLPLAVTLGLLAALGLGACGSSSRPADTRKSDFSSFKPGSSGANAQDMKSAGSAEGGAPTASGGDAAPKIEDSDVARVDGTHLLILNQWRGLQIVDLADPSTPKMIERVPMQGVPREMYIADGYATVILSNAYDFTPMADKPGELDPFAGTEVRVVALKGWTDATEIGAFKLDGWAVASRRIDDKLVVVTTDVETYPWWGGCYGYGGMCKYAAGGMATSAGAGAASDSATGVATSSKGGVAYPGGMPYYGYSYGKSGKVHVLDQASVSTTKAAGSVPFAGGVLAAHIQPGEVLLFGSQWTYDNNESKRTDRATQVLIAKDGTPSIGATWEKVASSTQSDLWNEYPSASAAIGPGAIALATTKYVYAQTGTSTVTMNVRKMAVEGKTWADKGAWTAEQINGWWSASFDGSLAFITSGSYAYSDAPATPGSLHIVDLSGAPTETASVTLDGFTQPATMTSLAAWAPGLFVLNGVQSVKTDTPPKTEPGKEDGSEPGKDSGTPAPDPGTGNYYTQVQVVSTISLADPKKPLVVDSQSVENPQGYWGSGAEVLAEAGLVLVGTMDYSKGQQGQMLILSVAKDGTIAKHGLYASSILNWSKLKGMVTGDLLLRLSNEFLEIVSIQDLALPSLLAKLELAANVVDVAWVGGRAVAFVQSWADNLGYLRTLKVGSSNEQEADATISVPVSYGRLYVNDPFVYVTDYNAIRVYDFTDPLKPTARGTFTMQQSSSGYGYESFYDVWDMPQKGSTLFLVGMKSTPIYGDASKCGAPSVDAGSSGGGSSGASGSGGASTPPSPGADPAPGPTPSDAGSSGFAPTPADAGSSSGGSDKPMPGDADAGSSGEAQPPDYDGGSGEKFVPSQCITGYTYTTRIRALDLSNPDAPAIASTLEYADTSWGWGARLAGSTLFMTHYEPFQGTDGQWYGKYFLDRVDVSDIKAMKDLGKINVPGWVVALDDTGTRVYSMDWQPVANSKPEESKIESTLNLLTIEGDKAYLASQVALPYSPGVVALNGKTLYVGAAQYWWLMPAESTGTAAPKPELKLLVYEASADDTLSLATTLDTSAYVSRMDVIDTKLFLGVGYGGGLQVWDVTKPAAPVYATFLPSQGWVYHIVKAGNAVYLPTGYYGIARHELTK